MITAEEDMLDKRKQGREDRNNFVWRRRRMEIQDWPGKKILRNVNLSVRAMVLSTFYHNTLMKELWGVHTFFWEICCIIVTKVTTTSGNSLSNTRYRAV